MKYFKLSIQNRTFGLIAPAMVVQSSKESEAEKIGRELSGLGRFKSWTFSAMEIKNRK
tara:strand:+ start:4961 stop:5134 length:174 start_codon:yes stop_codon:yes gene_type:complete